MTPEEKSVYMRQWRLNNQDKVIANRKKWDAENSERRTELKRLWVAKYPEKKKAQDIKYRKSHREKILAVKKRWRLKNPDKFKAIWQRSAKNNREKRNSYNRLWRAKNADHSKDYHRTWKAVRNLESTQYRTLSRLRARVHKKLKTRKMDKTLDLCGATIETILNHLESQFRDGMTWENQSSSGWHIDHILPCSAFDLTNPEDQKECFHYTNLQPLWWWENLAKSNKL